MTLDLKAIKAGYLIISVALGGVTWVVLRCRKILQQRKNKRKNEARLQEQIMPITDKAGRKIVRDLYMVHENIE